jgi:hypothetical protein
MHSEPLEGFQKMQPSADPTTALQQTCQRDFDQWVAMSNVGYAFLEDTKQTVLYDISNLKVALQSCELGYKTKL